MGAVVSAIGSILGGALGGAKAPKANVAPAVSTVESEEEKAKKARSALIQNAAGQAGAQLQPGEVAPGQNLFGN